MYKESKGTKREEEGGTKKGKGKSEGEGEGRGERVLEKRKKLCLCLKLKIFFYRFNCFPIRSVLHHSTIVTFPLSR